SMTQFSVLSLNINMGLDIRRRRFVLPELRDAIRSVGADIVLLQEVLGEHAGHARRHAGWPSQPQHEYLAETLWQNHDVSIVGHEPRGLLHALLDVPGLRSPLHVISVHLGLRESHRQFQVAALSELVSRGIPRDAPLLVAGDFNDWRLRGHALLLSSGVHEAFESAHGQLARTFPAQLPLLPLDRMYLRNLRTAELEVLASSPWNRLSDHAGLHASLTR